ncbi:hypothetical protein M3193_09685 [Sporosarcina luteola]|uniref:hypothetical protein n=1 Tax=Sporosarcina luteola TaxID=582850 RepID=UPI00203E5778|nr:hypothetical protein [Sporosarcina luteola]MCM3744414.1 hypothetical protein [Sporosarcina luteola]
MATKSKSDWGNIFSLFSICIAIVSIGYCFPYILGIIESGWERSSRAIAYFTRIIRGGTA